MSEKGLDVSTLTDEEETLLKIIIDKGLKEIKARIEPDGVKYEGLDEFLVEEEYDWHTVLLLFESLADRGFLASTEEEKALVCPECDSPHVYSKYACPRCQSTDVTKIMLLEHPLCGYTGVLNKFKSGSSLVCPNCNANLGPVSRSPLEVGSYKDYKIIGSIFECNNCHSRFDRPNILHICQKCDANFDYKTSLYEKVSSYVITEEVIRRLRETEEIKVLVIEDNPDDADIIKMYLTRSRDAFNVEHVSTGEEGLKKIRKNIYDIILLDYILPDMNGTGVLREMKKRMMATPVIVLTGADDRQTAVASMKLGASDYLIKSVDMYERLPSIIKQLVQN